MASSLAAFLWEQEILVSIRYVDVPGSESSRAGLTGADSSRDSDRADGRPMMQDSRRTNDVPLFVTAVPRFSYLALLRPRLETYFGKPCWKFYLPVGEHQPDGQDHPNQDPRNNVHKQGLQSPGRPNEDRQNQGRQKQDSPGRPYSSPASQAVAGPAMPLPEWPVGVLADLYCREHRKPWTIWVTDDRETHWDLEASFLQSVKEADFVRNGSAKQIMAMSKEHTTQLWRSVTVGDYTTFQRVQSRWLLDPVDDDTVLRNVPVRIFLPIPAAKHTNTREQPPGAVSDRKPPTVASDAPTYRVLQPYLPPPLPTTVTLGEALHIWLPQVFPSATDIQEARAGVVLHGAPVPLHAPLLELMKEAAYPDGWVYLVLRIDT